LHRTLGGHLHPCTITVVRLEDSNDGGSLNFRGKFPSRSLMLTGRKAAVSEICNSIRQGRFITLLGPGGIGKMSPWPAGCEADVRLVAALLQALKARC
jgi:hypothetical protein